MRVQFSLASVLSPGLLSTPFDVVSMQFCMHYAFETAAKAQMMLENVSHFLRPGGRFHRNDTQRGFTPVGTTNNNHLFLPSLHSTRMI